MKLNAVYTGLYRPGAHFTNTSLEKKISMLHDAGFNIHWFTWKGCANKEVSSLGVNIVEIEEPFPHIRATVQGRQRQIYNIKQSLKYFLDDEVILKLRWDLDFNDELLHNIKNKTYFEKIENGIIENKIWVSFYSIQELFSVSDQCYAGYKKDLNHLINFDYKIENIPADNYISHDGMTLMPKFIEKNKNISNLLQLDAPNPWSLMFKEDHLNNSLYLYAWAYNYYIFLKYFKTGPFGTCFFKRADSTRWPHSIVNYNNFLYNYETVIGKKKNTGPYPKYRVYDDIFINRLVSGFYDDSFSESLYKIISENKAIWEANGI